MANHKILVIDDSRVIRARVREMLPNGNFEVIEATDGIEGIDAIRAQKPNLIMLDFLLPRMSGYEVYQEIQSVPEFQTIPLVMMSGRREELTEKIQEPFEFFEFIEKPFEQKELIGAIKGAMAKARKARARKQRCLQLLAMEMPLLHLQRCKSKLTRSIKKSPLSKFKIARSSRSSKRSWRRTFEASFHPNTAPILCLIFHSDWRVIAGPF